MSDKLLLLTYFVWGIVIFYKVFGNKTDKKNNDTTISIWCFVPVWVMLMIQMWLNMWHGIG